jgi:hypothetical protein
VSVVVLDETRALDAGDELRLARESNRVMLRAGSVSMRTSWRRISAAAHSRKPAGPQAAASNPQRDLLIVVGRVANAPAR